MLKLRVKQVTYESKMKWQQLGIIKIYAENSAEGLGSRRDHWEEEGGSRRSFAK